MSDEATKTAAGGVLGRLPKWPRKALNSSVISAEQAYRQRTGLPLLTDADVEALKAGVPMAWEGGDGSTAPPAPAVPAAPAKPAAAAQSAPAAPAAASSAAPPGPSATSTSSAAISPEVAAIVAAGKK